MIRKHLFISLARYGWGEITMGLRVAKQLRDLGDEVFFLVNENLAPLLSSARVSGETLNECLGPLVGVLIEDIVAEEKPSSIILADHLVCGDALQRMGLTLDFLDRFGLPIIAIDTWNHAETGSLVDLVGGGEWLLPTWSSKITCGIVPAPFNATTADHACSFMPAPDPIPRRIKEHVRKDLGLSQQDQLAVLCTSEWQTNPLDFHSFNSMADSIPRLLSKYLSRIGPRFHLLHFAPKPVDGLANLGRQYHWVPSFPPMLPEQFQSVLGSSDLVLSLNYSATTNHLAIALGTPVMLVMNSCEAKSQDDIDAWLESTSTESVREWADKSLPLSRFRMWPLGFHGFLEPTFKQNELLNVCSEVELLREPDFLSTIDSITSNRPWKANFDERRNAYLSHLAALPSPGALVQNLLG